MGTFEEAKRIAGIHKTQRWLRARSKTEKVGLATLGAVSCYHNFGYGMGPVLRKIPLHNMPLIILK